MFCNISIGMASARSVVTIQLSNAEKQRNLPKCDWPMEMVNITPGVTPIFSNEFKKFRQEIN